MAREHLPTSVQACNGAIQEATRSNYRNSWVNTGPWGTIEFS